MKANELMIGDWVMPLKKKLKGIPGRVVTIDGGTGVCWIDSNEYSCLVPCSDVERIPLTSEIFEKNFNEHIPGINLMYDLKGPYMVSNENGQWVFGLVKDAGENSARYPLVKISFVHELQHALRLCGINKEIVL